MKREVDRFQARDDQGTVTLIVHQELVSVASLSDPDATIPGLSQIVTDDGLHCNRIDDDTFEIVTTRRIVKRIR